MEKLRYLTGSVGCLMASNLFIGCSSCPSCFGCAGFGIGMAVFSFIKRGSCKSLSPSIPPLPAPLRGARPGTEGGRGGGNLLGNFARDSKESNSGGNYGMA